MTIRFAAARGGTTPVIMKPLCRFAPLSAANDNPRIAPGHAASPAARRNSMHRTVPMAAGSAAAAILLDETLRHFGRFGLGAAAQARLQAETAANAGNHEARDRWIAICRQLDRRMADTAILRLAASNTPEPSV